MEKLVFCKQCFDEWHPAIFLLYLSITATEGGGNLTDMKGDDFSMDPLKIICI